MGLDTGLETGLRYGSAQRHYRAYVWNGRNRMRKYDGENWRYAGIAKSSFTPTVGVSGASGITGTYYYYIVPVNSAHVATMGRAIYGLASTRSAVARPKNQQVDISGIPATHADAQVDKWYIFRNKDGALDVTLQDEIQDFYYVDSVNIGTTTYTDTTIDDSLSPQRLSLNRELPPTFKYGAVFGDRLFGAGFDPITDGTATVNADTTKIDFAGVSIPGGAINCFFQVDGDEEVYSISTVGSTTQVTLDRAYSGALSGGTYSIFQDPSKVWYSEWDDFDGWGLESNFLRHFRQAGGAGSTVEVTGLAALGGALWVFAVDKIYRIYGAGPESTSVKIDPQPFYEGLGSVGGNSIALTDNEIYFLSLRGPARFDGVGKPELIGERLGTDWLDGLNASQLKVAAAGTDGRKVYFSVPEGTNTENSLTYVYDRYSDTWWREEFTYPSQYLYERDANGKPALFYTQGPFVWQTDSGETDGAPSDAVITGTITSSDSTSLTDTGASFATANGGLQERVVHVYTAAGTVKGSRRLASNTSTKLTWSSTGAGGGNLTTSAGDLYAVAPVYWWWQTKTMTTFPNQNRMLWGDLEFELQTQSAGGSATIYKRDVLDESAMTRWESIPVDQAFKKVPVQARSGEYAIKIESIVPASAVAIRDLKLENFPAGADK